MKNGTITAAAFTVALFAAAGSAAQAQSANPEKPWSVDFGLGWDNSISGNINSGAIGTLNGVTTVITKNSYEDVYGTGLHLRFGGGYLLNSNTEVRATFAFQSLDADLTPMGQIGSSNLYGQYSDYQSLSLDFGVRQYGDINPKVRGYGEALIGFGFVDKTDVTLAAPGANLTQKANDFYDQTAALSLGVNVGVLVQAHDTVGFFGQIGFRRMGGMDEIDNLQGTGLETINDNSSRWTLPFIVGIRARF
jgi:hypothetical protein